MLESFLNVFRVAELRKKIAFTLIIIALYRLGSYIPSPGIDVSQLASFKDKANQGGVLGVVRGRDAFVVEIDIEVDATAAGAAANLDVG